MTSMVRWGLRGGVVRLACMAGQPPGVADEPDEEPFVDEAVGDGGRGSGVVEPLASP